MGTEQGGPGEAEKHYHPGRKVRSGISQTSPSFEMRWAWGRYPNSPSTSSSVNLVTHFPCAVTISKADGCPRSSQSSRSDERPGFERFAKSETAERGNSLVPLPGQLAKERFRAAAFKGGTLRLPAPNGETAGGSDPLITGSSCCKGPWDCSSGNLSLQAAGP